MLSPKEICHDCKKKSLSKSLHSEQQTKHNKQQQLKKTTEPDETERSYIDKLVIIATELKHSTDRKNHITMTVKIDRTEKDFIVETGLPVKIIPPDKKLAEDKKNLIITIKYHEVKRKKVNFAGKITVEAQTRGIAKNLTMLFTERENIKPLIGID